MPLRRCQQGGILIAQPFLQELYFHRSCILMVEVNGDLSSTGVVLNKQTKFLLHDVIEGIEVDCQIPIFCGGPLSVDRLYYVHDLPTVPNAIHITGNLYYCGDIEAIIDYINSGQPVENHIKFFIGYSGWGNHQLTEELKNNVWAVCNHIEEHDVLTTEVDNSWENAVKRLGNDYRSWLLCPPSVSLN